MECYQTETNFPLPYPNLLTLINDSLQVSELECLGLTSTGINITSYWTRKLPPLFRPTLYATRICKIIITTLLHDSPSQTKPTADYFRTQPKTYCILVDSSKPTGSLPATTPHIQTRASYSGLFPRPYHHDPFHLMHRLCPFAQWVDLPKVIRCVKLRALLHVLCSFKVFQGFSFKFKSKQVSSLSPRSYWIACAYRIWALTLMRPTASCACIILMALDGCPSEMSWVEPRYRARNKTPSISTEGFSGSLICTERQDKG